MLILAAVLLAPATARASCGDYVRMGQHPAHATSAAAPFPPRDSANVAVPVVPTQKPVPPCSGPSCSRRTPIAPTAPVPPAPVEGKHWGCVDSADLTAGNRPARFTAAESSARPVHRAESVFHPPRRFAAISL